MSRKKSSFPGMDARRACREAAEKFRLTFRLAEVAPQGQFAEARPGRAHILFLPVRGPGFEREAKPDRREGRSG